MAVVVTVGDDEPVALGEPVDVAVTVTVVDDEAVAEAEPDRVGLPVGVAVLVAEDVALLVWLLVWLLEPVAVVVTVGDDEPVALGELLVDGLRRLKMLLRLGSVSNSMSSVCVALRPAASQRRADSRMLLFMMLDGPTSAVMFTSK